MDNFKVEEHLDWKEPEIWMESLDGEWDITITENEVEIEYDWDYGWGGRGTGRITISRDKFQKLLKKIDKNE